MKSLIAIALVTLATATAASAYSLSPPDTASRLRGRLTFSPEGGEPFKCTVTMHLRTKGIVKSIAVDSGGTGCSGMLFQDLPWHIGILNANTGQFGFFSYNSSRGGCQQNTILFQDNSSGIWTLPAGQCMSGTLTSNPPVTIVP